MATTKCHRPHGRLKASIFAFAGGWTALAVFCLLQTTLLHAAEPKDQILKAAPTRYKNSRIVTDPNGQRIAEIRWQPGMEGEVGVLRVPTGYFWQGLAMLNATFGPDYPDPNVVQPSMQGFILEALLPNFEPMTPQNASRFKDSFLGDTIQISIQVAPAINRLGQPTIDYNFRGRLESERPRSTNGFLFKAPFERKPDRFGLQRMGPVSDNFEQFKTFGFVSDTYFPAHDPKDVYLICGAEEIRDVSEDPSWRKRPTCEHHFYSATLGAIISLKYRRTRLSEWRALQASTENFFKSFEFIKPAGDSNGRAQQ